MAKKKEKKRKRKKKRQSGRFSFWILTSRQSLRVTSEEKDKYVLGFNVLA